MSRNTLYAAAAALAFAFASFAAPATAQQLSVKPVVEKRIKQLPAGPLYWRIENLPTLAQAQAAEGPTSLAAEVAGKVWLFTLGAPGGSTTGATKVAEVGPVPPMAAQEYLLRINESTGLPGAKTAQHTHPGSESFYVLAGRLGQKTPEGDHQVEVGKSMTGKGADTPMEVYSAGSSDLHALVMFVVDASKPFSSHASIK